MTFHTFAQIQKVNMETRMGVPGTLQVFSSEDGVHLEPIDHAPEGAVIEHHDVPVYYR